LMISRIYDVSIHLSSDRFCNRWLFILQLKDSIFSLLYENIST
jgi:hypothetical protein